MTTKESKEFLNNPDYDILTEQLFNAMKKEQKDVDDITTLVYHCSNERLNAYFKNLNLKNARVATVGSSGDQVLNSIFYGAKDVTLIDANIMSQAYVEYKIAMIKNLEFTEFKDLLGRFKMFNWKTYSKISHDLSKPIQQFFDELIINQESGDYFPDEGYFTDGVIRNNLFHVPCFTLDDLEENLFYNNNKDYNTLKRKLQQNKFKLHYIVADIKEFPTKLKGKFNYIFLSNIFAYIDFKDFNTIVTKLYKKINDGGSIQLHYNFGTFETQKESLLSKKTRKQTLKLSKPSAELNHVVYFIDKPTKEKSNELNN